MWPRCIVPVQDRSRETDPLGTSERGHSPRSRLPVTTSLSSTSTEPCTGQMDSLMRPQYTQCVQCGPLHFSLAGAGASQADVRAYTHQQHSEFGISVLPKSTIPRERNSHTWNSLTRNVSQISTCTVSSGRRTSSPVSSKSSSCRSMYVSWRAPKITFGGFTTFVDLVWPHTVTLTYAPGPLSVH